MKMIGIPVPGGVGLVDLVLVTFVRHVSQVWLQIYK
jgi:hypothetical protein